MKQSMEKIIIGVLIISILGILTTSITAAEPTVEELTHDPENPEILNDVSFTAKITGDDITAVHLFIQECEKNGVCFQPPHNISLSLIDTNTYSGEVTLDKQKAEVMKYNLIIQDNGVWYDYLQTDLKEVDLVIPSNGNGDSNNTPGFELIFVLVSISLCILLIKRKRA